MIKKFKSAQEYLDYIALELESANHHDYIDLPEKLFNKIKDSHYFCVDTDNDELALARIIAEEFDNNI